MRYFKHELDIISIKKICNWNPCVWDVKLNNGIALDVYYRYGELQIRLNNHNTHRDDMELIAYFEDTCEEEHDFITTIMMLPYLLSVISKIGR